MRYIIMPTYRTTTALFHVKHEPFEGGKYLLPIQYSPTISETQVIRTFYFEFVTLLPFLVIFMKKTTVFFKL